MEIEKQNRIVIYTAIFGSRDKLLQPKFIPKNCDFVCFTDQDFVFTGVWEVRKVDPPMSDDMTRSNRYYKMHPHKLFPEYDTSIYIDGNVLIVGDITKLVEDYLSESIHMAAFDHALYERIPARSLQEQVAILAEPHREKKHKESVDLIKKQAEYYFSRGFPDNNSMIWTMTLIRHHNELPVVQVMEAWWNELTKWSKRDQVSFNYVAWSLSFPFNYIPLDGSDNQYIKRIGHYLSPRRRIRAYALGAIRRVKDLLKGRDKKDI